MHKFKINLQPAFNKSEAEKTSPNWIKIDEHYRHTAIVIVSAMKLLGEQKQNRKLFIKVKKIIEFPSQRREVGSLKYIRETYSSFYHFALVTQ